MNYQFILKIILLCTILKTNSKNQQPETEEDYASFAYEKLVEEDGTVDRCFFAPQDAFSIEAILIGLIRSTQNAIQGALFRLSNKKIITELIAAHKRGVEVDIILDPDALSTSQEISKLSHAGIPLSLYNQKKYGTYMHHKFLIFHNTLACEQNNYTPIPAVIAFGSLNLTENGLRGNQENINFRNKEHIIQAFEQEVRLLKNGTDRYMLIDQTKCKKNNSFTNPKQKQNLSRPLKYLTQSFKELRKFKR